MKPTQAQIEAVQANAKSMIDYLATAALTAAAEARENRELCDGCGEPLGDAFCVKCCSNHPATIERCAQVAEGFAGPLHHLPNEIAAAIRALKDKP